MMFGLVVAGAVLGLMVFWVCFFALLSFAVGEDPREFWREMGL